MHGKLIFKNREFPLERTNLFHKSSTLPRHWASYFDKAVTHSLPQTSSMGTVIHGGGEWHLNVTIRSLAGTHSDSIDF